MNHQTHEPDAAISSSQHENKSPTPSSENSSRSCVSRGRFLLIILAIMVIVVMVLGIIFVAHKFYHEFGGQGFLKARDEAERPGIVDETNVFLPLRAIEALEEETSDKTKKIRGNVPYYTCGDQQESCQRLGQPNICCPIRMLCHPSRFSPSSIFCCDSTAPDSTCRESLFRPPQCLPSTIECSAATGGGCCPEELICSPNGCIRIKSASIIGPSPTSIGGNNPNSMGSSITISPTVTVIQSPASTATVAKEGEVAQIGVGAQKPMVLAFCVPYLWMLVVIAVLMATM